MPRSTRPPAASSTPPAPALKIAPAHPRLWIAPRQLPEFLRAANTYRRPIRDALLKQLEPRTRSVAASRSFVGDETAPIHALALGQAWHITRDEKYPRAALWMLEALWTYPTEIRHDYDVWGVTAETAALIYDWMHDYWVATGNAERIASAAAFCARQALTYFLDLYIVDDWHNYGLGLQAGVLAGALALGHDHPALEPAGPGSLLSTIHAIHFTGLDYHRTRLQDVYTTPRTRMCLDEHLRSRNNTGFCAHQEATGGYHFVDALEFTKMAAFWTSALQSPAGKTPQLIWPEVERTGEAHLQFLRPDLCNFSWGDSRPSPSLKYGLVSMLHQLHARKPNPVFAEFIRAFSRHPHARAPLHSLTHALLCATPALLSQPLPPKPLDRGVFTAWPLSIWLDPLAVLRSGWDKNATHVSFRVGRHGGGHNHFDHNSFSIFRGGPLAVDAGWVDYTHRSRTEYAIRTLAHNTLLVRNPKEKSWTGRHAVPTQNDGGQRLTTYSYNPPNVDTGNPHAILTEERRARLADEFDMGSLLAHQFHADFDYLAGDATRAYTYPWSGVGTNPSRRVEEFVRQLVFLKPDLIVIFDRVEATRPEYEKTWLLHTQGDPVTFPQRGKQTRIKPKPGVHTLPAHAIVEAASGRGRLTFWPLLPKAQTLRAIGGKGYETWIEHPAPPDSARGVNFTPPDPKAEAGRWRIELRANQPERRTYFLTVLHAGLDSAPRTGRTSRAKRQTPARDRFAFDLNDNGNSVDLTIHDGAPTPSNSSATPPPTTLTFAKSGPVHLTLTHQNATTTLQASAPQRIPRRS